MSHGHLKKEPDPPTPVVWWKVWVPVSLVIVAAIAAMLIANWTDSFPDGYEKTKAKILELKPVVSSTHDSLYGGSISYRIEAHVQYSINGTMQDRWIQASEELSRESVALKLSTHPTECLIYWQPAYPENARCSLR